MTYRAPVSDYQFIFDQIVDFTAVLDSSPFEEVDADTVSAILEEAGKLASDVIAPLDRGGDLTPAALVDGVVRTSPGFAAAHGQIAEGGWIGMLAQPENGGMGLPLSVATAINEMMSGGCLSLSLQPLMTQGQIEALEHHASDAIKELYIPKLISGEWTGTMNLTEPGAGSDVGALRTKAERNDDGSYAITGQKIFITWGDNDFSDNVCHLVLARLPDGGAGTKGISLFMVPKMIPDAEGNPGAANSLKVVSLEHKLGIHGSPTCVMQYDGATGWLVGEEHQGMKCMFTMMNNARLGVGVQGVGVAEASTQKALAYAQDRVQGKSPIGTENGTIIDHADVRRMLAHMRADTFVARSIALACGVALDLGRTDPEQQARGAFLIPIAKAFSTDIGHEVAQLGVQVHGGMGYIEETGAAQYARDARITSIYEGTNGIQAMDLVGRKLMDGGEAGFAILDEIESFAEAARATLPKRAIAVWNAAETLREGMEAMLALPMNDRFGGAVPFLRAFARVLGGHYHLKAAIAEGGEGPRSRLAAFYIKRMLPEHAALLAQVRLGAADIYALSPEDLTA
ncbi:acyl-CoA dehydrogenase [Celeribacter ethanolicus]|uniref:3-methylmercaptopropionyl-CoA dehydrogenase n=1 Tax=Celeribacter ethanolicus TaxID=1758178 RepID=A0A291GCD5_9RHOB|nr:acyl-CoA dehydrogenase [Celeribacter ethanolicus]ATG48059.1 acyl-CoA dehydrogenase [Celeribacter ethanolicus]TNE67625.1 MAG: acyl-CoA dehydrogenase [Paracoccaceae bacterium]